MRLISLIFALLISLLGAGALWFHYNKPVPVDYAWTEPLHSVSFAPFRRGQSPLTRVYPTPQQVEEDLQSLVGKTRGIRTYTAREGMDVVPSLASKLGLKVTFSAWLGSAKEAKGQAINESEVSSLIRLANQYPNEIERVIVGNEVLLRGDLKPEELIAYIRRVKAAVKQPVSYADVWAFYLKYPEVVKELDFLTIHILPFWEDEPVGIDHAEENVLKIVERIRQAFPGKPILIGETGWPSIGRERGAAVVSTVNEARYVRQMANIAAKYDFDYNIVEAFDQPWKSALENTVGAAWGILDIDRKPKFPMTGPVTEILDWKLRAGLALAAGGLATLWLGRRLKGGVPHLTLAVIAQLLAWLAVTSCFHAEAVAFYLWEDAWAVLRGGLAVLLAWLLLQRLTALLDQPALALDDGAATTIAFGQAVNGKRRWTAELLILGYGAYAAVWTFLLTVDGRYRDIPFIDFSVPVIGVTLLIVVRMVLAVRQGGSIRSALALSGLMGRSGGRDRLLRWVGYGLPILAVTTPLSEGLFLLIAQDFIKEHPTFAQQWPLMLHAMVVNREILLWSVMAVMMAIPFLADRRMCRKPTAQLGEASGS